jgi:hypothetical protein
VAQVSGLYGADELSSEPQFYRRTYTQRPVLEGLHFAKCFSYKKILVGVRGFEPPASTSRT